SNLVEQLFELARLDSDQVSLDLEPVSLADLSYDVVQSLGLLAKEKAVSMKVIHPENDSLITQADLPKLERVLINLIDNAIRHCHAGDEITIELKRIQSDLKTEISDIEITIRDTGIGIPKEDLPHIFDAYYRAGNSAKSKKGNSGLGLAISKKIVELHGSIIKVVSEEGEGTCFSFFI
ncbi:MAG: signal transduction histidine kinase, partial [Oleiphilaceae bacterium]